ncbi:threonine/serine dehydratase [Krasilnikovia sp. MM14-A1259]|uniref:threonine ammonia-lyase n=1 Tax=Krasilnikovia sp. MM14-A1259 TaxID=3373539 RepID=UPI00382EEE03
MLTATRSGPHHLDHAAAELDGQITRTPLLHSAAIDHIAGARILIKAENQQLGGSYKSRGALLAVGRLVAAGGCTGVVAQSTGNHGTAIALAARRHGLPATVVLPSDAVPVKVARIRRAGGQIIFAGTSWQQRTAVADEVSKTLGHPLVGATADVVAGQGTASRELLRQAAEQGEMPQALVLAVGGGSSIAGACLATAGTGVDVIGVEPVGCDSLARSIAAGRRILVAPGPTIADGLRPACVGELPFQIAQGSVAEVVRVDDHAIVRALRLVLTHLGQVVEPSAAAGLAGALVIAASGRYRRIGVVLTGGNIPPSLLARITTAPA